MNANIKSIVEAVVSALAVAWMVFIEFRLRITKSKLEEVNLELKDQKIQNSVEKLSDSDLKSALDKDLGAAGGSTKS